MTDIAIYEGPGGQIEVRVDRENIWLAQMQLVELFGRDQSVISRHVRNVFADGELEPESNMQKMHIAGSDKPVALYNLDVIIAGRHLLDSTPCRLRSGSSQGILDYCRRWKEVLRVKQLDHIQ